MPSTAGTVAIVAAISLVVQCILWLASFILYVVAYECIFEVPLDSAPVELSDRIILYLQGNGCLMNAQYNCYTDLFSPVIILTAFSIGAAINFILLIICFVLLAGFWSHPVAKKSVMGSFVFFMFLASIWDFVITGLVATDYNNLPSLCPGDALITVFMASCRGGFLLAANVSFAFYLLISLCSGPPKGTSKQSNQNSVQRTVQWTPENASSNWQLRNGMQDMPQQGQEMDGNEWQLRSRITQPPPEHTAAARFSVPPVAPQDTIHSRWNEYRGSPEDDWSPGTSISRASNHTSREQELRREQRLDGELIVPAKPEWRTALERRQSDRRQQPYDPNLRISQSNLRHFEPSDTSSLQKYPRNVTPDNNWKKDVEQQGHKDAAWEADLSRTLAEFDQIGDEPKQSYLRQRQDESNQSYLRQRQDEPNRSYIRQRQDEQNRPESRYSNITSGSSKSVTVEESPRPSTSQGPGPKIPADAFSYGYGNTFFGVRLKPVKRDEPKDSSNSEEKEELKEEPKPRAPLNKVFPDEPQQKSSPQDDYPPSKRSASSTPPPGSPEPPPQPPSMKLSHGPSSQEKKMAPMSLQEAILTRRPLKPVNRPHIDTSK